ncbi:MAG: hydrogenase iron-sulfur subunit [Desulfovibrionaceae bacterium]|jgi:quinone-modifying oxidoreductase subunit QmoB|nr:hydrogenase iron-sulfur subunit [Desulfovibrionaceae bacterium]
MAEKIGVYFDKSSIGPYFDYDELVEFVESKFGGLCPAVKAHPLLAGEDGRKMIQQDLDDGVIDSVLVCGATPRVDWEFYKFGNDVLVDRVNLREHCVLSYMEPDGSVPELTEDTPELLLALAKDYISMGVTKLQKCKIPHPEEIASSETILVLGGGWTGLTAALDASKAGHPVVVVEKAAELGGYAAKMFKSTPLTYPHNTAQDSGIEAKIAAVQADENIKVFTSATLVQLKGAPGTYEAVLSGGETLKVGAVVLATGWVPQSTDVLKPLGYGSSPAIVTTLELEEMAKRGELKAGAKVAFVLNTESCVGPEAFQKLEKCDEEAPAEAAKPAAEGEEEEAYVHEDLETSRHLPYASAVNTMVVLKQAGYVADNGGIAYVFYDHMIVPGIHERFYKAAQDKLGVMMTKAAIAGIEPDGDGVLVKAADTLIGEDLEVKVDLVVLPTGMVPATAKDPVMNFEYRQGPAFPDLDLFDGFADSNYICFPYETRRTGVYAAGAIRQPMMLDAAEDDAAGAALKAIQCLESINRGVSVHPRSGDNSYPVFNFVRCTQCKRCTEECPFGALDDDEKGTPLPNPTRCRRCGTCMGACPERVISFDTYNIDQIGSMIKQIHVPENMDTDGPRVLILACENDAYPALDMAAQRGHHWSPYVRILPVRCLGSVNAIWVADAMSKGMDGVMLLGCKYGDDYQCHFVKGSEICNRRKTNIAETLERLGVEPDRVEQYEIAIDEYDKVPVLIEEFLAMIMEKGPNPFKGY